MLKKVWKRIAGFLFSLMVILAVLLAGLRLIGLRPLVVTSGSMAPAYPVGSMIYVRPADPKEVEVGDPITYFLNGDTVATHRVVAIDAEGRGFTTKGDANTSPDGAPVSFDAVIGIPVFCIPLLGYVSYFVTHPPGLYLAIAVAAILVLLTCIPSKAPAQEQRKGEPAAGKWRRSIQS